MAWEERRVKLHAKEGKKDQLQYRVNYAGVEVHMEEKNHEEMLKSLLGQATGSWEAQKENEE